MLEMLSVEAEEIWTGSSFQTPDTVSVDEPGLEVAMHLCFNCSDMGWGSE